jgi:hypothetical protein
MAAYVRWRMELSGACFEGMAFFLGAVFELMMGSCGGSCCKKENIGRGLCDTGERMASAILCT